MQNLYPALQEPQWNCVQGTMIKKPKVGLTMGDAAGIGPEIVVKALTHKSVYSRCQPIVIGSSAILQDACFGFTASNRTPLNLNIIKTPMQAVAKHGTIDVLDVSSISAQDISVGTVDACAGGAAVKAIETGTHLTMQGELDALTTAPICKAAIHRAGVSYPGHTEMLAAFTNTPQVVMMLCTPEALDSNELKRDSLNENLLMLKTDNQFIPAVSFVTNHVALADVPKHLSVERIVEVIYITRQALIDCGISEPRLAVAGLNPHAGEDGVFGKEEEFLIRPAIAQARERWGRIDGPLPADALFVKASQGHWHAVIVMYHDQGNIPIKLLGFGKLVNVTLGLPIIRTSVDHGTAFDIAGKGVANEMSLVGALSCAARLARNF
ncbi:MAG: 4-hydroxythreonine-4-phosphate dehydrogenase PdxA [Candidatus Poribacteria bacterium]|nr:4-hydroxythreonine-4-phosphate dehydrogenase PdxA [Candidatus Poribacteria bacterium]